MEIRQRILRISFINGQKGLLIFLFMLAFETNMTSQTCREVIGYFPSWLWYRRDKLVNPTTIRYEKYSILNYAFFRPTPDGKLETLDEYADDNLLRGADGIVERAHAAGVRVLISVGDRKSVV